MVLTDSENETVTVSGDVISAEVMVGSWASFTIYPTIGARLFPARSVTVPLMPIVPVASAGSKPPDTFSNIVSLPVPVMPEIILGLDSVVTTNVKSANVALTGFENETVTVSCGVISAEITVGGCLAFTV